MDAKKIPVWFQLVRVAVVGGLLALAVVRKTLPKFRRCVENIRAEKSFRRFMRLRSELQQAVYTAAKQSSQWAEEFRTPAREMFRAGAFLDDVERRAYDVYSCSR